MWGLFVKCSNLAAGNNNRSESATNVILTKNRSRHIISHYFSARQIFIHQPLKNPNRVAPHTDGQFIADQRITNHLFFQHFQNLLLFADNRNKIWFAEFLLDAGGFQLVCLRSETNLRFPGTQLLRSPVIGRMKDLRSRDPAIGWCGILGEHKAPWRLSAAHKSPYRTNPAHMSLIRKATTHKSSSIANNLGDK